MRLPLYYNWHCLWRQKLNNLLTFVVVATVVFVLSVLLSFAAGIRASLAATGLSRNVLVLKPGATAESTSLILLDEAVRLVQCPGIARDATGSPMISLELCVQTTIPRRAGDKSSANVAIRGVDEIGLAVHSEVHLIDGRMFKPGALEIITGKAACERYADLKIGSETLLGRSGNREFRVVGIFEAGGGALENELWVPRTILEDVYGRRFVSSAVLQLQQPNLADEAIRYIKSPAVQLEAKREPDYYADLSTRVQEMVLLASILVGVMAFGAVFAVANTMYAAVDSRQREIAMLRTIGFERSAIVLSFLIESFLLCAVACATGLVASMFVNRPRQDFLSDVTWTALAYQSKFTLQTLFSALGLSLFVGVVGGAAPAIRAARTKIIEALRKA
ncbi:MAG: ABC transporter permease [Planctomycetes bacterium]|nr:ABC transporter permease [Planctomycetota bacterium]MBI3832904.1 ABC transporter permease [Planctomycetota bacterium]